jgi:hypothetical protein
LELFNVQQYAEDKLSSSGLAERVARQGFARGLLVIDEDTFIVGSSPATINVFKRGNEEPIKSINISMDLRNAIHGLELWPYGLN